MIPADRNKEATVRNSGPFAVTYRVVFRGAGWVEFVVQPGGTFDFLFLGPGVDINIQDVATMGVEGVVGDDAAGEVRGAGD